MRKSLAEQVQAGKLSLLERNRQITKFHSKMLAEEQGRLPANPEGRAGCCQVRKELPRSRPRQASGGCQIPMAAHRWAATLQTVTNSSLDQPSLREALDKAEEMILGLRDRNAGEDPVRSMPLRAVTPIETCCAPESGKSNAPTKPATRHLAKIKQSAEVLRKHGLLKFLELSISSLIEPVKSAQLRAAVAADANRTLIKIKGEGAGRGLFIDCASNIGQGYKFFSKYYTPNLYDYILVERKYELRASSPRSAQEWRRQHRNYREGCKREGRPHQAVWSSSGSA